MSHGNRNNLPYFVAIRFSRLEFRSSALELQVQQTESSTKKIGQKICQTSLKSKILSMTKQREKSYRLNHTFLAAKQLIRPEKYSDLIT